MGMSKNAFVSGAVQYLAKKPIGEGVCVNVAMPHSCKAESSILLAMPTDSCT